MPGVSVKDVSQPDFVKELAAFLKRFVVCSIYGNNIVACQGGGVSSKTRHPSADQTWPWNPLAR